MTEVFSSFIIEKPQILILEPLKDAKKRFENEELKSKKDQQQNKNNSDEEV